MLSSNRLIALSSLIFWSALAVPRAGAQTVATQHAAWLGCYDVSIADSVGKLQAYGTFALDTAPAPRASQRYLAPLIGAPPLSRPSWRPVNSDSLSISVHAIDSGVEMILGKIAGDSLRGRARGVGMTRDTITRQATARRRAPCYDRIPLGVSSLTPSAGLMRGQVFPQGRPAWIDADSLTITDARGSRYVRNVVLVTFQSGTQSVPMLYTFQALGGIAIGTMPSPSTERATTSPTYIVWIEDGRRSLILNEYRRGRWAGRVLSA